MTEQIKPEVGMVLCTKVSQAHTNAIVVEILEEGKYTRLLSDFGNLIDIETVNLHEYFTVSMNWFEAKMIEYPLPSVPERIAEQIELLQRALERYE